jgi:hypothetical protein
MRIRLVFDVLLQCREVRLGNEKNSDLCGRRNRNLCIEPISESQRTRIPGTGYMSLVPYVTGVFL